MKTLLLTEVFPPQMGGSGRWFWEIYSRLPREAVCIAAGEHARSEAFDQGHDVNVMRLPLGMPQWGLRSVGALRTYCRLFRQLRRLIREENVGAVHAGKVLQEGWLAWMLHMRSGLPYVVYVHGEELNLGVQSRELGWMMRRVFGRAERVIVNSKNTERLMRNGWNIPAEKVIVLHPGVDTKRFVLDSEDEAARSELGWENRRVILTVGRLQKRKGHDMLIRALPQIRESIPEVLYAIIGDGNEREFLMSLANSLGVKDSVQFLGEIADEGLIRCFQNCDLFALPNREVNGDIEGFGMVLLEAQACGKPVLAGNSGGTAETMIPGETGVIVDCTTPESIASAIIALLNDQPRLARMGDAARRWVVEQFDWESLAVKAKQIFGWNSCGENQRASAKDNAAGSMMDLA